RPGEKAAVLGPQRNVRSVALTPDGRWAATACHLVGSIRVWDTKKPADSRELLPRGGWVTFSPDGRWLLTWTEERGGESRLWHVGTWATGPRFDSRGGGAFTADGRILALAGGYGVVRLVSPDSGEELASLNVPDKTLLTPQCFTPDGRLIACGTESGAVYVW